MNFLARRGFAVLFLSGAGALAAGCGAGSGADDGPSSRGAEAFGAPAVPDLPDTVPCPAGTTCTFTPTSAGVPGSFLCSPAWWFSETGAASAQYLVTYCDTGRSWSKATLNAWLAAASAEHPVETTSLPGLPPAVYGLTYIRFTPTGAVPPRFVYYCPSGTCVQSTLPAPTKGCSRPWWVGAGASESLISECMTALDGQSQLDAWTLANPSFRAVESSTVPDHPTLNDGFAYVSYMLPTPTSLPGECSAASFCTPMSWVPTDPTNAPLPCTQAYELGTSEWVMYCVDTPAVEAWGATNLVCSGPGPGCGGGVSTFPTPANRFNRPPADPGYTYIYTWTDIGHIGTGCTRGCQGLDLDP